MSPSPREPAAPISEERLREIELLEEVAYPGCEEIGSMASELLALRAAPRSPVAVADAALYERADRTFGAPLSMAIYLKSELEACRAARSSPPAVAPAARFWCTCSADPVAVDDDACCAECGATAWTTSEVEKISARIAAWNRREGQR